MVPSGVTSRRLHMPPLRYYVFDAFTTSQFKGNPAAVVILPQEYKQTITDNFLQSIASEFNLAETAFVSPPPGSADGGSNGRKPGHYSLRWFTPTTEFPLCGHATLSATAALFLEESSAATELELSFHTLSGVLHARQLASPDNGMRLELELPAGDFTALSKTENERVTNAVRRAFFPSVSVKVEFAGTGSGISFQHYLLVEVEGVSLEGFQVDASPLNILRPRWEVIIFTQRPQPTDSQEPINPTLNPHFISRVFCPLEVIPEDPVTGSAHCMLGPYWATRLGLRSPEIELQGIQVSSRGGNIGVVWDESRKICRLRGSVTLVAKGGLDVMCM